MNYLQGFGNYLQTEALPNILVPGHNAPQKVAYGLYAEQLSLSAFTVHRAHNLHSWLYRLLPSVKHGDFTRMANTMIKTAPETSTEFPPTQMRWSPLTIPKNPTDFIEGLVTMSTNGNVEMGIGGAVHLYAINTSMKDHYFYNADGELLFVPQNGSLRLKTEFGVLEIAPKEIAVIPRGVKFQVELMGDNATGYICENYGTPFQLPELGLIGANGLAHARDFCYPVAAYEDKAGKFTLITKFHGQLWQAPIEHSPLNVVAWHGNCAPYKYDLRLFNTINSVSWDHPDPSIFTVLTSPSDTPGVANIDFVIFPERWMVAEETFRPPYFHRNIMSEFMGLIAGIYDAKEQGFIPGGSSVHNCMSAHGPDMKAYEKAVKAALKPEYYHNILAFMFESRYAWRPTEFALTTPLRHKDYLNCWHTIKKNFKK